MESPKSLEKDLKELRESFRCGKTKEAAWRMRQLKGLSTLLKEKEEGIFDALRRDMGKHKAEAYRDEIGTLIKSINYALANLKGWMSAKKAPLPLGAFPTTAEVVSEPLGVVLIISTWNFPIGLSLEPLIGALAAGNTVVIKPSELTPTCSSLLANTIPIYLDNSAVKIIEGDASVGEQLLRHKWDKILFTGSARVGRMVMLAAAEHLTPVTLELGGKCPAVVDCIPNSRDRTMAMKRIVVGKYGTCAGQACIAIDYILVEKKNAAALVEALTFRIKSMFGDNPRASNSLARIVNRHHFLRLKNLLVDPKVQACVVYGGSMDENTLFVEPTILLDPPHDADIMTEEIFGPLLPIITLNSIEESIEFINLKPKAPAAYIFTKNESLMKRMISETSSGSLAINDCITQFAADTLPFGGVGESGFGRYHGKFSFHTFSHEKGILRRSFLTEFWFRFPPWNNNKLLLLRAAYIFDYIAIVLIVLGLKKS